MKVSGNGTVVKLEVGVYQAISGDSGWFRVLEQEKLPYRITSAADAPVILFERSLPDWVGDYVEGGGVAVVTDADPESPLFRDQFAGYAAVSSAHLPIQDLRELMIPCLAPVFQGAGFGEIRLHEKRISKAGGSPGRVPLFLLQPARRGQIIYSGVPFGFLLSALGDTLRRFSAHTPVTERVSSVDKEKIVRLLVLILRQAFFSAGLPYLRAGYYPDGARSIFLFRIDIDGVFGDRLKLISDAGVRHGIPICFFANRSLCWEEEHRLREINRFHEVGNHGDVHNLFDRIEENRENISRCREWLDRLGVKNGPWYAAPRGMWNFQLGQALERLSCEYSSDFGFAFDGLPFFPRFRGRRMQLLQIPVHPYSAERAGIFAEEQNLAVPNADESAEYFRRYAEHQVRRGMPVYLYSHPERFGPVAEKVLSQLAETVKRLDIPVLRLSEFCRWWKDRDREAFAASFDPERRMLHISEFPLRGGVLFASSEEDFQIETDDPELQVYREAAGVDSILFP